MNLSKATLNIASPWPYLMIADSDDANSETKTITKWYRYQSSFIDSLHLFANYFKTFNAFLSLFAW